MLRYGSVAQPVHRDSKRDSNPVHPEPRYKGHRVAIPGADQPSRARERTGRAPTDQKVGGSNPFGRTPHRDSEVAVERPDTPTGVPGLSQCLAAWEDLRSQFLVSMRSPTCPLMGPRSALSLAGPGRSGSRAHVVQVPARRRDSTRHVIQACTRAGIHTTRASHRRAAVCRRSCTRRPGASSPPCTPLTRRGLTTGSAPPAGPHTDAAGCLDVYERSIRHCSRWVRWELRTPDGP